MRLRSLFLAGFTLGILLFQIAVARSQESLEPHVGPMTRERFLTIFEAVVFGDTRNAERVGEKRWTIDGVQYLTKWTVPVRIAVFGAASDRQVEDLKAHADLLSELTTLPVTILDARNREDQFSALDDFEILSIFSEVHDFRSYLSLIHPGEAIVEELDGDVQSAFDRNRSELKCVAWTFGVELKQVFAITYIRSDLEADEQAACIEEETTQVFGLPNDVYGIESIFNDDQRHKKLTKLDRALVKALYHPEMKVGLTRNQAMTVLQQNVNHFGMLQEGNKNDELVR